MTEENIPSEGAGVFGIRPSHQSTPSSLQWPLSPDYIVRISVREHERYVATQWGDRVVRVRRLHHRRATSALGSHRLVGRFCSVTRFSFNLFAN
jgi:hypothetical protein